MATVSGSTHMPLNVCAARGTRAAAKAQARGGVPGEAARPEEIAPGISPTPAHDLMFHGGKTIANLVFTNFYVAGDSAWNASDIGNIDGALAAAMSDRRLNNVMAQYFPGQSITSESRPSRNLPGEAPATFSQGDVENLVANLASQGILDGFDFGSTVFNVLLPPGTILNTNSEPSSESEPAFDPSVALRSVRHHRPKKHPNPVHSEDEDSTNGLGGYHGSVQLEGPDGNSAKVYYAVGVYSEVRPDGTNNGIPVFDQPWKNVVATFYHELNEARTDADVEDAIKAGDTPEAAKLLGWVSQQGEECGDFPVFEANPLTEVFQEVPLADGSGTVPVQFQYSNAVHGPEGPIDQPHSSGDSGGQPQPQPHHHRHKHH